MPYLGSVKHKLIEDMNLYMIVALALARIVAGVLVWRNREMIVSRCEIAQRLVSVSDYVTKKLTSSQR